MERISLIDGDTRIRVSSTLDKSVSKKHLVDGSPETCWTSQQGLPQYIHLTFPYGVIPKVISMTFQGGFVGTRCKVQVVESGNEQTTQTLTSIFPEDVNRNQTFELPVGSPVDQIKIVFEESSDFFGRITVYDLQIDGLRADEVKPDIYKNC